jgi:hypothetical protein
MASFYTSGCFRTAKLWKARISAKKKTKQAQSVDTLRNVAGVKNYG